MKCCMAQTQKGGAISTSILKEHSGTDDCLGGHIDLGDHAVTHSRSEWIQIYIYLGGRVDPGDHAVAQ